MIAIALALQVAATVPAFDTATYCRVMGDRSQSYMLEQSCRQQEKATRERLAARRIPARVAVYCARIAHVVGMGDSYSLFETCVDQELDAASRL